MSLESKIIGHIKKNIANEQEEKNKFELPEDHELIKKVEAFKSLPKETLTIVFDAKLDDLNSIDWDQILQSLREDVLVKYNPGKGLVDDSEEYDKQWYSKLKISEKYDNYYSDRFNEYYKEKLGTQVRYTLSRDTESILNLCGSPKRESVKHVRGLVFGFVQSGKTLNYASVCNAAMGAGYDMIVVLAGGTNILRNQTQSRLNHDLIGQANSKIVGVGKFNNIAAKKPISLTSSLTDFNTREANAQTNGITLENIRVPVIAIIKKNVTPLKNLKEWLENQAGNGGALKKSILVIDDESDYASVNTKESEDPTTINKGIRELLNSFDVATYLAVTATPFANILIGHENTNESYGADLFPRSFIWTLDKPDTYIGVKETLGENFVDLYSINLEGEEIEEHLKFVLTAKKRDHFEELPFYVKHAICKFLYDSTCLRQERKNTTHLSMLVNISRLTHHHIEISGFIEEFIDDLNRIIKNSSMKLIQNKWLLFIKRIAEEDLKSFDSIEDFWKSLEISLSATKIFDIHQRSKVVLTYPDGIKMNSILVGGLSLSRGFTVEGLITSVFIRTTKTFDALMQMGRWFGHKKHILKYITVYTTPTIRNRFELIEESIVDLLDQIDEMKRLQLPPTEFGLNIRRHPNVVIEAAVKELRSRQGLDIVSRAKRKHAKEITLKLSLGDRIMETVRFLKDVQSVEFNNELVNKLFINLENEPNCNKYHPEVFPGLTVDIQDKSKIIGFIDVPNEHVKDFISNFKLPPQRLSETNAKLPLRFLLDFIDNPENISLKWDISLVTGEQDSTKILDREFNKVKRSFELSKDGKYLKLPKNQLSIPAHEFRFLLETYTSMIDRKKARIDRNSQTGKPLLLIYPIKPVEAKGVKLDLDMFDDKCLWGWSISMPGSGKDDDYISVLANSVLLKQLMEDYDQDLELEEYEDN